MNRLYRLANPVIGKEFRIRMRSAKTPLTLLLYLSSLGAVVFTLMYFAFKDVYTFSPDRTHEFFILLSILQYALIIFITPGLTAGIISGEKERQTLSILLTTNLSPWQIVIGKWFSSLSFMLLLVVSSAPLYSIIFLFGGISPAQLLRVFGIYIITMLAIGAVGIFVSTIMKRTGAATVVAYSVIFGYTALLVLLSYLLYQSIVSDLQAIQGPGPMPPLWTHPLYGWLHALDNIDPVSIVSVVFAQQPAIFSEKFNAAGHSTDPYWIFILFYGLVTVVFLWLSGFLIRKIQSK
ncbi:ABC transporter permease [Aneurinibacillus terranovensis]|uniref:ABC transporter permease n=1 Tax=Aneurinibacillus terranovensis TaxID=278991 RepID=UPI00041912C9|nr:ABC transporter permease [Aneurinibacillus terranovensis]